MSSDEGEHYDIERILAEKTNDEGEHVYLVKWEGYPDEECTWEPPQNFDDPDALRIWAAQKARGDTLDAHDLQRIQDQIDAFKAREDADAEGKQEEDNPPSRTASTDLDETQERPRKRLKLVPDVPLLPKKGTARLNEGLTSKKQLQKLRKTSSPSARSTSPRLPIETSSKTGLKPAAPTLHRPPEKAASVSKPATPPYHASSRVSVPSLASSSTSTAKPSSRQYPADEAKSARVRPQPQSSATNLVQNEPLKFYGPEMPVRARGNVAVKRDNTGKRFNNYQHMNNVRKKMREERPPPMPSSKVPHDSGLINEQISEPMQSPAEHNASWLFFGRYDDEESRQNAFEQSAAMPPTVDQNNSRPSEQIPADGNQPDSAARERTEYTSSQQAILLQSPAAVFHNTSILSLSTENQGTNNLTSDEAIKTIVSDTPAAESLRPQATSPTSPRPVLSAIPQAEQGVFEQLTDMITTSYAALPHTSTPTRNTAQAEIQALQVEETRPRPRRNSLFNRSLPSIAVADQERSDPPPQPRSPQREPLKPLPSSISHGPPSIETRSGISTASAQRYISQGEIVRAYNGREWQKGDVVLDLYMADHAAGVIKLLHVPWNWAKPIVAFKQGAQLPIGFCQTLSRPQYELLAQERWFSYFAIGAVEPFADTAYGVASLAKYLEDYDVAGLWDHPEDDITLILYSCRSPSWQDLGQKPVRHGEPRLHIAFRRKLQEPGPIVETLARIVERGKCIEEEEARGREAQHRSQTIEQRNASRRRSSSSRSHTQAADPRREARRARSALRPQLDTAGERERDDEDGGRTSRCAGMAPTAIAEAHAQPASTLSSPSAPSPGVQLLRELNQMTMSPGYDCTGNDAMDISPSFPPVVGGPSQANSTILIERQLAATTDMDSNAVPLITEGAIGAAVEPSFPGLDRDIKAFAWSPELPKIDRTKVFMILVYKHKHVEPDRIQELKSWLTEAGLPIGHIFDKSVSGHWADLSRRIEDSVCVVLFDKQYPVTMLDGIAKLLERDNLLCWEIDYRASADRPLAMTKLFPRGIAMAIPEGCFVHEPNATLRVLRWFKAKALKPWSASRLMIPPSISFILQEQAILARKESSKKQFLDMARLLYQMMNMNELITDVSDSGVGEDNNLNFAVVQPPWSEMYKNIPQSDEKLSAIEAKERDEEKDDQLLQYFGAWAAQHLEGHRRFIAFTINDNMGKKPKNIEHVRLQLIKGFADRLDKPKATSSRSKESEKGRDRSRSRLTSAMSTPRS